MPVVAHEAKQYTRITVAPLTGALGAEVCGVGGNIDLADCRRRDVRRDPRGVPRAQGAVLPGSALHASSSTSPSAGAAGDLEVHPFIPNDATHPEVVDPRVDAGEAQRGRGVALRRHVPGAARRWARCCGAASSPRSAATRCWANMELAYEGLTDEVEVPDRGQGGGALDGEGVRPLDVDGGAGRRRSRSIPASTTRSCAPTPRPAGAAST